MRRAYEEIVEFIARGCTPAEVVAFKPSEATKDRVWELLERRKDSDLPPEDESELNHYLEIEHLMRLAKARALSK